MKKMLATMAIASILVLQGCAEDSDDTIICTTENILLNSGFELGTTDWTVNTAGVITNAATLVTPRNGDYVAWMLGLNSVMHTIYQNVTIPADTVSLTLSGYSYIITDETDPVVLDQMTIQILSSDGVSILDSNVGSFSNLDDTTGWASFSFGLDDYAGQTIRIYMNATSDSTLATSIHLDDLALDAETCN